MYRILIRKNKSRKWIALFYAKTVPYAKNGLVKGKLQADFLIGIYERMGFVAKKEKIS